MGASATWPLLGLLLLGCRSGPDLEGVPPGWELGAQARTYHAGPLVSAGAHATRRWCERLFAALPDRARPQPTADLEELRRRLAPALESRTNARLLDQDGLLSVVILGEKRQDEVVALLVDTGAASGATDAAWMAEGVLAVLAALDGQGQAARIEEGGAGADVRAPRGRLARPLRSLAVLFGEDPVGQLLRSEVTLPSALVLVEGVSGPSDFEQAVLALERSPDHGRLQPLAPDGEGPWSREADPRAGILSVFARMALVDVGTLSRPWSSLEHPTEAGGPVERLAAAGAVAVRFHRRWLKGDPDPRNADFFEIERTVVASLTAAAALADARPEDLDRVLDSLLLERRVRLGVALDGGHEETAEAWEVWLKAARDLARRWCLGL